MSTETKASIPDHVLMAVAASLGDYTHLTHTAARAAIEAYREATGAHVEFAEPSEDDAKWAEDEYLKAEAAERAELAALRAENEMMKAALNEIRDFTCDVGDDDPLSHVYETARAALQGETS